MCTVTDTTVGIHASLLVEVHVLLVPLTLDTQVQDDIVSQLRLSDPLRLVSSFNRPNISYSVTLLDLLGEEPDEAAASVLTQLVARHTGPKAEPGGWR